MTAYAADTWLTPVVLDASNNVLVITEDPGGTPNVLTLTLDAGTWFLHDDTTFHATRMGLYYGIRKLLTDGTTAGVGSITGTPANTYTWALVDPASSTGLVNNGLQLRADSAVDTWEVTWTGATTLDARLFGSILASPISDDASVTSGADEIFTWPYATLHRMVTRDLGDGYAVDKRRRYYKDKRTSSSRPAEAQIVVWDDGSIRTFRYEDVPGVEVYQTRASEAEWAGTTGRATGDNHATWYYVWDALGDGLECVVVHDSTGDLQVDTHDYEIVRQWTEADWPEFAQEMRISGDYYAIEIDAWISSGTYTH